MNNRISTQNEPYRIDVEAGQAYFLCACGKSSKLPFCDGTHKGSDFTPTKYVAEKTAMVAFCGCQQSGNYPLCDGTHRTLNDN